MNHALKRIVEAPIFNNISLAAILLAGASVGLETSPSITAHYGNVLRLVDAGLLCFFVAEVFARFLATAPRYGDYFKDGWNIFDLIVIALCLLPMNGHFAAVIRLVRVLRVLRVVRAFPRLRIIVSALLKGMSSMAYIAILLTVLFYIYAVVGVFIFGKTDALHFGSLPSAFLTLFQIVTLEGWVEVMRVQLDAGRAIAAPIYFVSFIVLGTMIVLNLFIGTIVGSMTDAQEEHKDEESKDVVRVGETMSTYSAAINEELLVLEKEADELRRSVSRLREHLTKHSPA